MGHTPTEMLRGSRMGPGPASRSSFSPSRGQIPRLLCPAAPQARLHETVSGFSRDRAGKGVSSDPPPNTGELRDVGLIPGSGRSPEEGMATHSSILAWRTPWTEEPKQLSMHTFMHWRRKWQPTPVFLPGESQGIWLPGEPGGLPSMGSHRVGHN